MLLSDLSLDVPAMVVGLAPASAELDSAALRRLGELGFLPGEPVWLRRRGPGGREPLAVQIGDALFALRLVEAHCVHVQPTGAPA